MCFPAYPWWFSQHSEWVAGERHKGTKLNFCFCPNLRMSSHLELVSGLFALCVMKSQSTKVDFGSAGRKEWIVFLLCMFISVSVKCAKLTSASALLSSAEGSKVLSIPRTVLFPVAYHVMQLYEGNTKLLQAFVPEALSKKITCV